MIQDWPLSESLLPIPSSIARPLSWIDHRCEAVIAQQRRLSIQLYMTLRNVVT